VADFSILIPHTHTALDVRALRVALDTLVRHTVHDYELILEAHSTDNPYPVWNHMVASATTDWIVFSVTDHFFSPGWDVPLWEVRDKDMLIMGTVVESGYRPVAAQCLERDFGRSPESYNEAGFNSFAAALPEPPTVDGWVWPWMVHRETFLELGAFQSHPILSDLFFFQKWLASGRQWKRVKSYCYHLQAWNATGNER